MPAIHVYAVRLIDGGHLLPRALVRLDLTGSIRHCIQIPELTQLLSREVTVDFFDPPQRETIREEAVRLIGNGMFQRDAARQLGVTQPAVQRALELNDMMLHAASHRRMKLSSSRRRITQSSGDIATRATILSPNLATSHHSSAK